MATSFLAINAAPSLPFGERERHTHTDTDTDTDKDREKLRRFVARRAAQLVFIRGVIKWLSECLGGGGRGG